MSYRTTRAFERNNWSRPTFSQALAFWMKAYPRMTNQEHVRALVKLWDLLFGWHAH